VSTQVTIESPVVKEIRDRFGEGNAVVEVELTDGTVIEDSLHGLLVHTRDLLERLESVQKSRASTEVWDGPITKILPRNLKRGQIVWVLGDGWIVVERIGAYDVFGDVPVFFDGGRVVYLEATEPVTVQVPVCDGSEMPDRAEVER
jgi:hypothetical protein